MDGALRLSDCKAGLTAERERFTSRMYSREGRVSLSSSCKGRIALYLLNGYFVFWKERYQACFYADRLLIWLLFLWLGSFKL